MGWVLKQHFTSARLEESPAFFDPALERIYIWCCSPQLSAIKLVMASQISTA